MHRLTPFSLLNLPLQGLNFVEVLFVTENSIHVNVPQARFTLIGEVAPRLRATQVVLKLILWHMQNPFLNQSLFLVF